MAKSQRGGAYTGFVKELLQRLAGSRSTDPAGTGTGAGTGAGAGAGVANLNGSSADRWRQMTTSLVPLDQQLPKSRRLEQALLHCTFQVSEWVSEWVGHVTRWPCNAVAM